MRSHPASANKLYPDNRYNWLELARFQLAFAGQRAPGIAGIRQGGHGPDKALRRRRGCRGHAPLPGRGPGVVNHPGNLALQDGWRRQVAASLRRVDFFDPSGVKNLCEKRPKIA